MKKCASRSCVPPLALCLFFSLSAMAAAQTTEVTLGVVPNVTFPVGPALDDGLGWYAIGGGASLQGDILPGFAPYLYTRLALDYEAAPLTNSSDILSLAAAGAGIGVKFRVFPWLDLRLGGPAVYTWASSQGIPPRTPGSRAPPRRSSPSCPPLPRA